MPRGLAFPPLGPAVRGGEAVPLTLRPRGFSTFGLREKCMRRAPSSLTVTDTFFSVLFPQCAQNTRLMSDVVLETQRSLTALEPQAANPSPGRTASLGPRRRRRRLRSGSGQAELHCHPGPGLPGCIARLIHAHCCPTVPGENDAGSKKTEQDVFTVAVNASPNFVRHYAKSVPWKQPHEVGISAFHRWRNGS